MDNPNNNPYYGQNLGQYEYAQGNYVWAPPVDEYSQEMNTSPTAGYQPLTYSPVTYPVDAHNVGPHEHLNGGTAHPTYYTPLEILTTDGLEPQESHFDTDDSEYEPRSDIAVGYPTARVSMRTGSGASVPGGMIESPRDGPRRVPTNDLEEMVGHIGEHLHDRFDMAFVEMPSHDHTILDSGASSTSEETVNDSVASWTVNDSVASWTVNNFMVVDRLVDPLVVREGTVSEGGRRHDRQRRPRNHHHSRLYQSEPASRSSSQNAPQGRALMELAMHQSRAGRS